VCANWWGGVGWRGQTGLPGPKNLKRPNPKKFKKAR